MDKPIPVPSDIMQHFYSTIDREVIDHDRTMKLRYNDYQYGSLLKLFILPYLWNVPSERAIERELKESQLVREISGFGSIKNSCDLPTRATLWHFRNKYFKIYREYIYKLLSVIFLESKNIDVILPFVFDSEINTNGESKVFSFSDRDMELMVKLTNYEYNDVTVEERQMGLPFCGKDKLKRSKLRKGKRKMSEQLGIPAEVIIKRLDKEDVSVNIVAPNWMYDNVLSKDRNNPGHPEVKKNTNIACNILVLRSTRGNTEVLLAKRLEGSFGRGDFAAPGGTVKFSDKNIYKTAKRELEEEANLKIPSISDIRPTSLRYTDYKDKPPYLSLGFVTWRDDLNGRIIRREKDILGPWQWFDISNLPDNLFGPTQAVIEDYLNSENNELDWSTVKRKARIYRNEIRRRVLGEAGEMDPELFD